MYVGEKWKFSSIVPKLSQFCKIISNNFENGLLGQIIIDKYTVGNLNDIDIDENIVTFVHILSSFNGKITFIANITIVVRSRFEVSQIRGIYETYFFVQLKPYI